MLTGLTRALLIVGGFDDIVVELNRTALSPLAGENRLEIVPGATHLIEEPGTLEAVAQLAGDWLTTRLQAAGATDRTAPSPADRI